MPADLRDLFEDAARGPQRPLDLADIRRRARRSRLVEVSATGVAVLLLIVGVLLALDAYPRPNSPIIGDGQTSGPSMSPSSSPSATQPGPGGAAPAILAPSDLGVDVLVVAQPGDGTDGVVVHHPDGTTTELPVGVPVPAYIFPDDAGGFSVQSQGGDGGSAPILHVSADGQSTELISATFDPSESFLLVGGGDGGALVTHRRGTTPDDMTVDLLRVGYGGQRETVATGVAGWESSVMTAATLEHAVYTLSAEGFSLVAVDPADAEPTFVFEGGEGTGTYAVGVDVTADGRAIALIDDPSVDVEQAAAQLLVIDPATASITTTIEVPLQLDTDAPFIRASGVSVEGGLVVVNRRVEGEHLRPLVYELAEGTWSVLDVTGPALLARAVPPR